MQIKYSIIVLIYYVKKLGKFKLMTEIRFMDNYLISIVIPVYNAQDYIKQTIESLIFQTYKNIEIIIIDDGSTDSSSLICDFYENKDKRIKVIHQKNRGVQYARNVGIKEAKGEYIAFCDSDDYFRKDAFELINSMIVKYHSDIIGFGIFGNSREYDFQKEEEKYYSKIDIENSIFPILLENKMSESISPSLCNKVIKKTLLENILQNIKVVIGEDLLYAKVCLYHAESVVLLKNKLYFYVINENSMTRSNRVFPTEGPLLMGNYLEKYIDLSKCDLRKQLYRLITHQLFVVVLSQYNSSQSYNEIKKKVRKTLEKEYYRNAILNCEYDGKNLKGNVAKILLKYKLYFFMFIIRKLY